MRSVIPPARTDAMNRLRIVAATVAAALAVVAVLAQSGSARSTRASKAATCPNAEVRPTTANLAALRAATLCLINGERDQQGRTALAAHRELGRAAGGF